MAILVITLATVDHLSPAERARHLRYPEGEVGLAVAEYLNANNRQGNARTVALLNVQSGHQVLEIGFGNGRTTRDVVSRAENVRYVGIDISQTMVTEAARFNQELVRQGIAVFLLGSAEALPFSDGCFDRVFSTGVIHFWAQPLGPLAEVRRVMSDCGMMVMGCLAKQSTSDMFRTENGFHLREATEWTDLCRAAGFSQVNTETLESDQINADGTQVKRFSLRVAARP